MDTSSDDVFRNDTDSTEIINDSNESSEKEGPGKIFSLANIGLVICPAISTSVATLLMSFYYQFFIIYLGASGNLHSFNSGSYSLAQVLSFGIAILSDGYPIFGRRRKPYQIMAWSFYILVCIVFIAIPLPPPRHIFSVDSPSENVTCEMLFQERLSNPNFRDADTYLNYGFLYLFLIAFAVVSLTTVGATFNGLIVDWTKQVMFSQRGKLQTHIIVLQTILNGLNYFILGFGFNWYRYAGPWCKGITMTQLFIILLVFGIIGLFSTIFFVTEKRGNYKPVKFSQFFSRLWETVRMVSWQKLVLFVFFASGCQLVISPADALIVEYWIKQESLTGTWASIGSELFSAILIGVFSTYIVNGNWRYLLLASQGFFTFINFTLTNLAIFDVLRNQYLYTPDTVFKNVNMNLYIVLLLIFGVEYTEKGFEATFVTGLTLALNAGTSFFNTIAVFISAPFNVSTAERYLSDTREDEFFVALVSFIFNCINFFVLLSVIKLMPINKTHCKHLKETTKRSSTSAVIFLFCFVGIWVVNISLTAFMPIIQRRLAH